MENPVQHVRQAFKAAEESWSHEFDRLLKLYKAYRAQPDSGMTPVVTRSQYVVPVIYKTVETILPRIISVVFSASPPIQSRYRVKPTAPDAEQRLRNLDQMFAWHFDRQKLFWVVQAWIKESLIYGQSYLKVGWRQKIQNARQQIPDIDADGNIQIKTVEKPIVVEDTVDVQNVDIFDLFFSPEAHYPDPFGTSKYVIHRSRKRKSQIIAMRDAGQYDDFEDYELRGRYDEETPKEKKQAALSRQPADTAFDDRDDPMVTVYEYWEDDWVITTADHQVCLRNEPNPYGLAGRPKRKPFISCCDNLVFGMLFQIGEAEPLEHNQIERSTLRRQRTDNNSLAINTGVIYDKDSEFDLASWGLSRPGMAVGVRTKDGNIGGVVMPIPRQEITGASYKEDQDLDKDSQEISGLLDYAVGASPERSETATTVQLLQAAANARFDIKVRNYATSFQDLGWMMYERWKQLQTKPIPLRVPRIGAQGFEFAEITRDDLPEYEQVDLVCPGTPGLLLKDARQQKLMQFYAALSQNPAVDPMVAKKLMVVALKEADIDGIEDILQMLEMPPPPPMMDPSMGMDPSMADPSAGGAPGMESYVAPQAPQPPRPEGLPQVNEAPVILPSPSPQR